MTHKEAHIIATGLILFGGVGLLAIAGSAAASGVWAAVFIGVLGVSLVITGVWGASRISSFSDNV